MEDQINSEVIKNFTDTENRFLSNSYPYSSNGRKVRSTLEIKYNGIIFNCITTAYIAAKSYDFELQEKLSKLSPMKVKEMDRNGEFPPPEGWEYKRLAIMKNFLEQKFVLTPEFKKLLIKTKGKKLIPVENEADEFWEINPETNSGEGKLGKELELIRKRLTTKTKYKSGRQKKNKDKEPLILYDASEVKDLYGIEL